MQKRKTKSNPNPTTTLKEDTTQLFTEEISTAGGEKLTNENIAFVSSSVILFAMYTKTAYPSIGGGDSGELVNSIFHLGTPHPPGYPMWILITHIITKLMSVLFTFEPAYLVTITCSLYNSLAAFFLARTIYKWTDSWIAATVGSFLFGASPQVWETSLKPNIAPFSHLVFAVLLYIVMSIMSAKEPSRRIFSLFGFFSGIMLTNEHYYCIPLVGFLFALWTFLPKALGERILTIGAIILAFFIGLMPYLLLYKFNSVHFSWGSVSSLYSHVFGSDYGSIQRDVLPPEQSDVMQRINAYWHYLNQELSIVIIVLAALGLLASVIFHRGMKTSLTLIGVYVFSLCTLLGFANLPEYEFFQLILNVRKYFPQINIFLFMWISFILSLEKKVPKNLRYFYIFAITALVATNFQSQDQHNNHIFEQYGRAVLEPLPQNSILFASGEVQRNTISYLQAFHKLRTDVRIVALDQIKYPWYAPEQSKFLKGVKFPRKFFSITKEGGYTMKELLDANCNTKNIECFVLGGFPPEDESFYETYTTRPFGLTQKIATVAANTVNYKDVVEHFSSYEELQEWLNTASAALPTFQLPENTTSYFMKEMDERFLIDDYWYSYHLRALTLLNYALEHKHHQQSLLEAQKIYTHILKNHPVPSYFYHLNLGLVYDGLSRYEPAKYQNRMIRQFQRYLEIAPYHDETYKRISELLQYEQ